MPIRFRCEDCQKIYAVDDSLAGGRVKCKACGHVMQVPGELIEELTEVDLIPDAPPPPVAATHGEDALSPGLIKLIAGIIVLGVIACVVVIYESRTPAKSPVAQNTTNTPSQAHANNSGFDLSTPSQDQTPPLPNGGSVIFPDRPANIHITVRGVVRFWPITITGTAPGLPMHMYLYLPLHRDQPGSLPCVFIAPAGTSGIYGMSLSSGDQAEHIPYVQAGFAVLAYELSGNFQRTGGPVTLGMLREPVRQYMNANGGLTNARMAVDWVLAKVPEVDQNQLFAAGHSSAATVALDVAAADRRIHAVAAYAPATDLVARLGGDLAKMDRVVPGTTQLAQRASPILHINDINCPVLLFHADDDENVHLDDNSAYASALQAAGKSVDFQRVRTGGHYQSMIDQGIPAGIQFFKSHGAVSQPPVFP